MSHRNRVRSIALAMAVPFILAAPGAWNSFQFKYFVLFALFGFLGFAMLKDSSSGESPKLTWAYGGSGLMFSYMAFREAWTLTSGLSFGLSGLTEIASTLFSAWVCALCAMVLFGMTSKKVKFKDTSALPIMATSWGLGVVATLTGLSGIWNFRTDGFFGTIASAAFVLAVTGFGVLLVKGKQAHLACFGLGTALGSYCLWTVLTNDLLWSISSFTGKINLYGMIAAATFAAIVGTWTLGTEVAAAQSKKLSTSKKRA